MGDLLQQWQSTTFNLATKLISCYLSDFEGKIIFCAWFSDSRIVGIGSVSGTQPL
jgi:hypothetical protein